MAKAKKSSNKSQKKSQAQKSQAQKKSVTVDRKFLLDLARSIYDSKSRRFMNLCAGTLQNGPDPKDAKRPMHCGLGELYFAMTGFQPEETGVSEDEVVNLAWEKSSIYKSKDDAMTAARAQVQKLDLPSYVKDSMLDVIDDNEHAFTDDKEDSFRDILNEIPDVNDGVRDDDEITHVCSPETFKERAKDVAEKLREAAMLLPK